MDKCRAKLVQLANHPPHRGWDAAMDWHLDDLHPGVLTPLPGVGRCIPWWDNNLNGKSAAGEMPGQWERAGPDRCLLTETKRGNKGDAR
jgi:hypothetical protein